jgi:hypothetical protein
MIRLTIISILFALAFGLKAQTVAITDSNFRKCLITTQPQTIDANGQLIVSEAQKVFRVACSNSKITSVGELVNFTNLRELIITKNPISALPSIPNPTLVTALNIGETSLTSLPDFQQFPNLDFLSIHKLNLTQVPDLTKNTKLKTLILKGNNFNSIPLLDFPALEYLDLSALNLTSLPPLNKLPKLRQLDCYSNSLTSFPDFSSFDSLKILDASVNKTAVFPKLPVGITNVYLESTDLDTLPDLSGYTKLVLVKLANNYLTFSDLIPLTTLANYLTVFKVSPQKKMTIGYNQTVIEKDSFSITTSIDKNVSGLGYKWFLNGIALNANQSILKVDTMELKHQGNYTLQLTHALFPSLVLQSDTFKVDYVPCFNLSGLKTQITPMICFKQGALKVELVNQPKNNYSFVLKSPNSGKTWTSTNGEFQNLNEPTYTLKVLGERSCVYDLAEKIQLPIEECEEIVITPNGDQVEENFYFSQVGTATLMDKFGNKVGELNLPLLWDARVKGQLLPRGYYLVNINKGEKILKLTLIY